jgi:peptide/nickel transport system substrate-binding protein
MLNDLSSVFIVSKRATQGVASEDFGIGGKGVVGTGPFRFVSFSRGVGVELARNETYWGKPPVWEKVSIRFLPADASRLSALLAGQVDAIENVPTNDFARVSKMPGFGVFAKVSHRVIYFALDLTHDQSPFIAAQDGTSSQRNPLKDIRVRRAISKAINRAAIADKIMEGLGRPTGNLVPSPMFGYNSAVPTETFDPLGARRLMAEAGYANGFRMTLHGPNDRYIKDEEIVVAVAAMLKGILGIDTRVETLPASVFFSRASRSEFAMALAGWGSQTGEVSSPLRSLIATWNKEKGMGTANYGRYSNAKFDALLEEGLRTVDDARREALFKDAVKMAMDDVALIPLHHQVVTWATRKGLAYTPRTDERTYAHEFRLQ